MKKNRNNQMIEIMRFIACVVILLIHCGLPGRSGNLLDHFGRFAVPFFILTSGYFSGGENLAEKSGKKANQTLFIIAAHGSLCLLWNCLNSYLSTGSFTSWIKPYLTLKHLRYFILYNRAVFINSAFYYLFMMLYVYAFCQIISRIKHISIHHIYVIAACLFLMGYCRYQFTSVEWFVVGNFLFTGIPLFFLGHFFHAKQQIFRTMKGKEIPIILFGLFVTYLEANMLNGTYLSIGQITIASSLLCLCINNSHIKGGFLAFLGSHCSLYVMLYHCQIRDTAQIFVGPHPFIVALVTLIISIRVAIIIDSFDFLVKGRQKDN